MELFLWIQANYIELFQFLGTLIIAAEFIVRLTPTKSDDGFVHRVGSYLDKLFDILKIPNSKKKPSDPVA